MRKLGPICGARARRPPRSSPWPSCHRGRRLHPPPVAARRGSPSSMPPSSAREVVLQFTTPPAPRGLSCLVGCSPVHCSFVRSLVPSMTRSPSTSVKTPTPMTPTVMLRRIRVNDSTEAAPSTSTESSPRIHPMARAPMMAPPSATSPRPSVSRPSASAERCARSRATARPQTRATPCPIVRSLVGHTRDGGRMDACFRAMVSTLVLMA